MIASTLWAEITISGFIFLLSGAFLTLKYLGVRDLSFVAGLNDYATVLSVLAIAASYILGILIHRLISIAIKSSRPLLLRLRRADGRATRPGSSVPEGTHARTVIMQYGSDRLLKELDFQFNFLALFSQLAVALPLLGISAALWLADTAAGRLATPVLVIGLVMGAGFVVARVSQGRSYERLEVRAYHEVAGLRDARLNRRTGDQP